MQLFSSVCTSCKFIRFILCNSRLRPSFFSIRSWSWSGCSPDSLSNASFTWHPCQSYVLLTGLTYRDGPGRPASPVVGRGSLHCSVGCFPALSCQSGPCPCTFWPPHVGFGASIVRPEGTHPSKGFLHHCWILRFVLSPVRASGAFIVHTNLVLGYLFMVS